MRSRHWAFALAVISTVALADDKPALTLEQEARWLIGKEYTNSLPGERIAPGKSNCTYAGGSDIDINGIRQESWSASLARCQGRMVIMLERLISRNDAPELSWRIIDTLVLPPYDDDLSPRRPNSLELFRNGDCELDGKTGTDFIALIRLGKRDKIDWRTGVEQAWTFDIERGRIVPLSTRRIVCYRPDPP